MSKLSKRLVIHIGTPKTGTTSIQNSLGISRKVLLNRGIYYPSLLPYNHGSNFIQLFIREPQNFRLFVQRGLTNKEIEQELEMLKEEWLKQFELCEAETFIISAENLSNFSADEIFKFKEFIEPYFEDVTIVAYIRPFKSYISSMVQELIKQGRYSSNQYDDFTKGLVSPLTFTESIKHWIEIFGEQSVNIRPFNPEAFYKGNLLSDFLQAIGYEDFDMSLITETKMNESFGKNGITILSELNAKYPLIIDNKINLRRGLASTYVPRVVYERVKDEKFKLDIHLGEKEVTLFNEAIQFLNHYLPSEYALTYLEVSNQVTIFPSAHEIPPSFYVELLNEYHKEIELHYKTHVFYERLFQLVGMKKTLYIWGAGAAGVKIKELISKINIEVEGFIDSDSNKEGTFVDEKPVFSPTILEEQIKEDIFIIVGSSYVREIVETLVYLGFEENENFLAKYIYY